MKLITDACNVVHFQRSGHGAKKVSRNASRFERYHAFF